jgi:hypothetical protein|tara:strand:+ start:71 stop:235 length:165 start_codon:yes stop_codon:yes gene_type:complete
MTFVKYFNLWIVMVVVQVSGVHTSTVYVFLFEKVANDTLTTMAQAARCSVLSLI